MSIRPDYFTYLEHFGKTVPVKQLFENPHAVDMIALRHDVDHDLDLALEMSYWEHRRDIRATYYLLHSAEYWKGPRFIDKCLQIQDFGHEVGLHLNILTEWMEGNVNDIAAEIERLLLPLRKAGIHISGVSTHGDSECYKQQFINYWCFSELKSSDPDITESGLCAEGIPVEDQKYQIKYPQSHRLVRSDGATFSLWSVSMKKLGIDYDASHVPHDSYFTDSGGAWQRSDDPLKNDLGTGRTQILMHPIYWRGLQKIYFFLSTARSGSKWLVNFLDRATPLTARHEFTLNHRYNKGLLVQDKYTAEGFTYLVRKKEEAKDLILEICRWVSDLPGDYAEANVYLERFLPLVKEIFHDAALIHLHRDPRDVVRSIINRDWYDTPEDDRHPVMEVEDWDRLGPFEKACWYVRQTNETLLLSCKIRISFEQMTEDLTYLKEKLEALGIPVFPKLADSVFDKKINANYINRFPPYDNWTDEHKKIFHTICDPVNRALGYKTGGLHVNEERISRNTMYNKKSFSAQVYDRLNRFFDAVLEALVGGGFHAETFHTTFTPENCKAFTLYGCRVHAAPDGLELAPAGRRRAFLLLGRGRLLFLGKGRGWKADAGYYYRGVMDAEIGPDDSAHIMCLMYNRYGILTGKRLLGRIKRRSVSLGFSFKVRGEATKFDIAVHIPPGNMPAKIKLRGFSLEKVPLQ